MEPPARSDSAPATVTEQYEKAVLTSLRDFFLVAVVLAALIHLLAGTFATSAPGTAVLIAILPAIGAAARRFRELRPNDRP